MSTSRGTITRAAKISMTVLVCGGAAVVGGLFGDTTAYRAPLVIASFWDTELSVMAKRPSAHF